MGQSVLLQLRPIWEQWDKYCRIWCSGHLNNCDDHIVVVSGGQKKGAVERFCKKESAVLEAVGVDI